MPTNFFHHHMKMVPSDQYLKFIDDIRVSDICFIYITCHLEEKSSKSLPFDIYSGKFELTYLTLFAWPSTPRQEIMISTKLLISVVPKS